jgi:hypothetical protein
MSRYRHHFTSAATAVAVAVAAISFGADLTSTAFAQTSVAAVSIPINIPLGALPSNCEHERTADDGTCVSAVILDLDSARAAVGLGAYNLPADFISLSGAKQIFILTNLDRIAYGLPPITGISPTLNAYAHSAMREDEDPNPTQALRGLGVYTWTSNWAGKWNNAVIAYYEWMYADGYSGITTTNVDCSSATASGCFVHRRNILAAFGSSNLAAGLSVGRDERGRSSYTLTIVGTAKSYWTPLSYTWAQAQAAGAGAGASTSSS